MSRALAIHSETTKLSVQTAETKFCGVRQNFGQKAKFLSPKSTFSGCGVKAHAAAEADQVIEFAQARCLREVAARAPVRGWAGYQWDHVSYRETEF